MKMYLVEYTCLATSDPVFEIRSGENEEDLWHDCYLRSRDAGYLEVGSFSIYRVLRNPNGELYLADLDGNPISSAGVFYARIH